MLTPVALKAGDTVAVVSLSAGRATVFPQRWARGKRQLGETFALSVIEAPNAGRDPVWLRANPQARAEDLHWALTDPDVTAIITAIGGEETIRTVPFVDLDLIRQHPKILIGFSDSTVQTLLYRAAGVVSYYGPSLLAGFAENAGMDPYTTAAVRQALFTSEPFDLSAASVWTEEFLDWGGPITRARRWWPNPGWQWLQGEASVEGELIGGCMEVLEIAKGSSIWPPDDAWDGAVLHLELSEEAPPPDLVGHWLRNYTATGILGRISALLLSRPLTYTLKQTFTLWDTVQRELADAGRAELPLVANLDYGHSSPMGVLPMGCRVRVDPAARRISVLDPPVAARD